MVKKATKATKAAPARAPAFTMAQAKDWTKRLESVEAALTDPMASAVSLSQHRDSLAAQLRAVRDEVAAALDRTD